jgi:hypothetical protein
VSKKDWTTTIPTYELIEMSLKSNEDLQCLKDILEFSKLEEFLLPDNILNLVCELIWLDSSVLLILRRDMTEPQFYDEEQKEVIIPETTLKSLLTLMLAKNQAMADLNSYGYSVSLL